MEEVLEILGSVKFKSGQISTIDSADVAENEIVIAWNGDKSKASLYTFNGTEKVLLLSDVSAEVATALTEAKNYTDTKISGLVNGAPEAMDTLSELAAAIAANSDIMTALQSAIGGKVDKTEGKGLSSNDFTDAEKEKLAGVEAGANNYSHPATHDASMITQDTTHRFVSDAEKEAWNSKIGANTKLIISGGEW